MPGNIFLIGKLSSTALRTEIKYYIIVNKFLAKKNVYDNMFMFFWRRIDSNIFLNALFPHSENMFTFLFVINENINYYNTNTFLIFLYNDYWRKKCHSHYI